MANNKQFIYGLIAILISLLSVVQVKASTINASIYKNYFGTEMTNDEYNTLLDLGFSSDEIYYMDEQTFSENKDADAALISKNEKYYKSIYTGLDGNSYSLEISKEEYDNQPLVTPRTTVSTEYKTMVTTLSKNGSYYRFKVSLSWKNMPSTRSYDIIGAGFEQTNIYINSSVYFNYHYCNSSGDCSTESYYQNKKKLSTGGSAAFKFPNSAVSMSSTLYYDVAKNTSGTVNNLEFCGDYAHATSSVSVGNLSDYDVSISGLELGASIISRYDAIPCALSTWSGTW